MADALPSIYQNIQAPAGANPQDVQSTRDQMAMQFAPQENSITSTINTLNQYLQRDMATQQQYGQVADQKIAAIGNEVAGKLQGNVGAIGDIYKQGASQVGSAYDEAAKTVNDSSASIINRLQGGYNNLGIKADAYGNDPISRLMANQATQEGRIATGKAGSVSNLATLGTSLQGIAQKAVGDSVQDYAQKRTNVATQVLKVIGQLQATTNTSIQEQLQKFSDLAQTEGPAFRQLLTQATNTRNTTAAANAQQAFKNYIDSAKLDIAQQNADKTTDPNSLDNIIKQQTIAKNNKALDRSQYSDSGQGNQAMMDWLNDLRVNRGILSGTQYAGIQNFINQNAATASTLNQDPYDYLVSLAQSKAGAGGLVPTPKSAGSKYSDANYQVPLQVLIDALSKRYTGVASSGAKIGTSIK